MGECLWRAGLRVCVAAATGGRALFEIKISPRCAGSTALFQQCIRNTRMPSRQSEEKEAAMLELRSAMLALADARKLKELTNTDGKYTVATDGEFGIGIRETPEVDGM